MRITFENTVFDKAEKVTIEVPYDDLDVDAMMELVKQGLMGLGYQQQSIEDYFNAE